MRKTILPSRSAVVIATLVTAFGLTMGLRVTSANESPATDCLVGLLNDSGETLSGTVSCTDCDPNCDADTDNSTPNGQCTFKVQGCVDLPVAGCTARQLKKATFGSKKNPHISVTPNGSNSVCGAFTDLVVKTGGAHKKKGTKPGTVVIKAQTRAVGKPPAKDVDHIKFVCNPRPAGESCPTTTTTTTSTTTTTLAGVCGDGVINGAEECDPQAATTGCSGNATCMPAGTLSECTCKTCTAISPAKALTFVTGSDPSQFCGDQGFASSDATGAQSGTAVTDDATPTTFKLGAGCLYIGGGNATVPGGLVPDASNIILDALQDCQGEIILTPKARTDDASTVSCTQGSGPGKACFNDLSNWPNLTTCTTDADCPHTGASNTPAAGSCVDKPNCLFGTPLPIANGGLSTCVINSIGTDAGGSVDSTTGAAKVTMPLRSHTFLTGNSDSPCPVCDSMSNQCTYGSRSGMACTAAGSVRTTIQCPPDPAGGAYLPEFQVDLTPLSTGTSTKTNADGLFCPSQTTFSAFGTLSQLTKKVVTITETGSPAGDISGGTAKDITLGSVFCIPATGNALIDGAADLPGPGAVSLPGTFQLQ